MLPRDEFLRVAKACERFRIKECTPDYLQDFLVARLREAEDEDLAQRLSLFGEVEMHELGEQLRAHQAGPPEAGG
jgi:hypothetical protein